MNISRRDFLKGTAAGALGLAASSLIAPAAAFAEEEKAAETAEVSVHQAMAAQMNPQDYDFRDPDSDLSAVFSPWQLPRRAARRKRLSTMPTLPKAA